MKVVDAIARILKIEGAEFLSAYPTTTHSRATSGRSISANERGTQDVRVAMAPEGEPR